MTEGMVIDIISETIKVILILSLPMLVVALFVGLVVAIFQATTQIQEQTLAFVPKILGVFGTLMFAGPWILQKLVEYTMGIFNYIDIIAK
ncbi:MAG: flagellar biosynthesis protein FliQ [Acidaminobacteraceae bacterium]